MPEQVPQYSEYMGYAEEPLPAFTPYCPQMLERPFMQGAFEEQSGLHPTGLVPKLSEWLTMPDACLQCHQPDLPIGRDFSFCAQILRLQTGALHCCVLDLNTCQALHMSWSDWSVAFSAAPNMSGFGSSQIGWPCLMPATNLTCP